MNVLVTIKETANINAIAAELVQKGFVVTTTLSEIGVITGNCPADRRAEIEQIDGISSVEDETEMTTCSAG